MVASVPSVKAADVCAVVVTYNPDTSSCECIHSLIGAADHTFVIDNRSEENLLLRLRNLVSARATLIENSHNAGVAAALNQGIRAAAEKGYRWFLLLDQDSRISPSSITELVKVLNDGLAEVGSKLGLLGSNFFHGFTDGSVEDARVSFCPGRTWQAVDTVITAGTILSLENFEAIGPFREDFFIDHVDHEYCLRARHKGFIIGRTVLPLIVHRLGWVGNRRPWLALGKKKIVTMYSPLRRYYQVRNLAVLTREYEKEFPQHIQMLRQWTRREVVRALKYEGHFFALLLAIILAVRHSRRGIMGKYNGSIAL